MDQSTESKLDISICIAHRGDPLGLWATIHSCEIELAGSSINYEYRICVNGEAGTKRAHKTALVGLDLERILTHLHKAGRLGRTILLQSSLSPPTARQRAAEGSNAEYLFFLDNHCLVAKGYFTRALHSMRHYGMDMLHSTTRFFSEDPDTYHYKLQLAKNFWATASMFPEHEVLPYKIAVAGHGGFAVRNDVWKEVGGYWEGFKGYGGEEVYFDLKMSLLGKSNFIDPQMIHYHYAGTRSYARHYSIDFYRNMLMCSNIIGGTQWLYKVYDSFTKNYPEPKDYPMFKILQEAEANSCEHAKWLDTKRSMSLNDLLDSFVKNGVAFT